jgi:hypothetical protein
VSRRAGEPLEPCRVLAASPRVSPPAAMSEAGHHDRANRLDDAAAGDQEIGQLRSSGPRRQVLREQRGPFGLEGV